MTLHCILIGCGTNPCIVQKVSASSRASKSNSNLTRLTRQEASEEEKDRGALDIPPCLLFLVRGCFPPISMSLSSLWHGGQLRKEFYGVWRVPVPAQPLPNTHPLQAAFVWAKWGWMHPFNFDFHSLLSCIDGEANSIWACFTWCHAFKRHMLSVWRGTTLAKEWTPKIMKRNITLFMTTLCGSYLYLKSCFMCSQGCRSGWTKPYCSDGGLKRTGSVRFLNCINVCVYFTFKTQSPLPADHSETHYERYLWESGQRFGPAKKS